MYLRVALHKAARPSTTMAKVAGATVSLLKALIRCMMASFVFAAMVEPIARCN